MQEIAATAAITSLYNNILSCYDWRAQLDSLLASMKVTEPEGYTLLLAPILPGPGSKLSNMTTAVMAVYSPCLLTAWLQVSSSLGKHC